jgi:hypothetical protein
VLFSIVGAAFAWAALTNLLYRRFLTFDRATRCIWLETEILWGCRSRLLIGAADIVCLSVVSKVVNRWKQDTLAVAAGRAITSTEEIESEWTYHTVAVDKVGKLIRLGVEASDLACCNASSETYAQAIGVPFVAAIENHSIVMRDTDGGPELAYERIDQEAALGQMRRKSKLLKTVYWVLLACFGLYMLWFFRKHGL